MKESLSEVFNKIKNEPHDKLRSYSDPFSKNDPYLKYFSTLPIRRPKRIRPIFFKEQL